jgi:hypothetical protein
LPGGKLCRRGEKNAKKAKAHFDTIFDCYFFHIPKSFYTFVPSNSARSLRACCRAAPGPATGIRAGAKLGKSMDLRFY